MNKPLISIIIPNYNRANLISETLDSILAQTYTNWECIIVDDGSTDNSKEVIQAYVDKDSRFQLHDRPVDRPKGANACRNYGFELSKGEYINWLDSDDLFSNDKIASQIETIHQYTDIDNVVVTSKWSVFSNNDFKKPDSLGIFNNYSSGYELIIDMGKHGEIFAPHAYLFHRNIFIKSGLWNEQLLVNQDGEFIVRVLLSKVKVIHAEGGICYFRRHKGERVSRNLTTTKANHLIHSWILINSYLNVYNSDNRYKSYIDKAKSAIYYKLKTNYPMNIAQHKCFFEKQIKNDSIFNRVIRKVINYPKSIKKYGKI